MNTYIFNRNAVLAYCPEYKKYLVDIKSLKDDAEQELMTIPEVNPWWRHQKIRTEEELEVIRQMSSDGGDIRAIDWLEQAAEKECESPFVQDPDPVYVLNPIYQDQPRPEKMNPLQLLPPKCVLDVGSEMFFPDETGWHMSYRISANSHND